MNVSLVGSTLASTGAGQGTQGSSVTLPAIVSSQANASTAAVGSQAPSPSQLAQAVKQVNDAFSQKNQNVYATIAKDPATGIDVVKFIDKDTKEAISQYPSKAILAIAESLQNSTGSGGQLINAKA